MGAKIRKAIVRLWLLPRVVGCTAIVALFVALLTGCTRRHYRLDADWEADWLIQQKSCDPRWALENFNVYPDPRSRFYDPSNPDRPPMPPDDPTSNLIMRCVYGKHGYRRWYRDGEINEVTNPDWEALLPTYTQFTPEGEMILDLPTSALLARLDSSQYQRNLEEVYLSALDVAFERFRFDVQFFGGNETSYLTQGDLPRPVLGATGPGVGNSRSVLSTESYLLLRRRFATGADFVVGIANSMVWQFAGPDTNFATSIVNFSLFQPLLRGGGKVVVLETLTRAERTLLANLRSETRFIQGFYKNIAIGGSTGGNPDRIGGFQGGAGLTGFTGTGLGGFGGVGAGQNFGTGGGGGGVGTSGAGGGAGLAGGGEGLVGGFYGIVQRLQTIRNTEASLASQLLTLGLLEANFDAGLIDLVQVDQFRQNIETERASLLRSQVNYRDNLELYMVQTLGLPPYLPVKVDDSLLRQFQLIAPKLIDAQNYVANLVRELGELPVSPPLEDIQTFRDRIVGVVNELSATMGEVADEHQELVANKEARRATIRDSSKWAEVDQTYETIGQSIEELKGRIQQTVEEAVTLTDDIRVGNEKNATDQLVRLVRNTSAQLQELSLLQARLRTEKIYVTPLNLDFADAIWIASNNRLDWMNRRAALVDQWRLIAFNANRLLAVLDIALEGDIGTEGDNPVRFRSPTGSLRGRVVFDAPLTRVSERNLYRESLIDYQRARRSYISYVDGVSLQLRSRLRQLKRLEENLEIQRVALNISIRRVDRTLEDLNRPFNPPMPGQLPDQLGPTLSQNLLQALSDFRNTQDNFMSVWLNHMSEYMELLFDLGIIQFDDNGLWIKESVEDALARMAMTGGWNWGCKEDAPSGIRFLDRVFPPDAPEEVPPLYLEEIPSTNVLTPLSWFEEDLGLGIGKDYDSVTAYHSEPDFVAEIQSWETVPQDESPKSTIFDRVRERLREGVIKPKDPTATLSREEFLTNLYRVRELSDQGYKVHEIIEKTGLPASYVLAYQRAAERVDDEVLKRFQTPKPKSPIEAIQAMRPEKTVK